MIFTATRLPGAYIITAEKREDQRGFFARIWCEREFAEHGLTAHLSQASIAYNRLRGTLRGMHYQTPPDEEAKVVRCTRGAIFDVILDLRPGSPAYKQWIGVDLTAASYKIVYVPEGCAHGYLTLEDDTEISYQASRPYAPHSERGVRYDDPVFGIRWPFEVQVISDKDRSWPDFGERALTSERVDPTLQRTP